MSRRRGQPGHPHPLPLPFRPLQALAPAPAAADGGDFTLSVSRRSSSSSSSEAAASAASAAADDYFETVPQGLASSDSSRAPSLGALIKGPRGKEVQQCVRACVPTCIRGGQGSPGLGPMSMR